MAFPGFFLHMNKDKVFGSESFGKTGMKFAIMKVDGSAKSDAVIASIAAFKSFSKREKSHDMEAAFPFIRDAASTFGFTAEYIPSTVEYPHRIKFMPNAG